MHVVNICMPRGGRKCTPTTETRTSCLANHSFPAWTRPPLRTSAVEGRPVEGPSLAEAAELHLVRFYPSPV